MASTRQLGQRSSLLSHSFPSFYACYLLKSVQTPQSTAIYIGSTPSPPRRIRQHNGELTQGAKRTRSKRPWAMQMIVHGFPSRLAALQFEWAWQHPHKSRHLRDSDGGFFGNRASKLLKKNVLIVRAMISRHPFNTWPLHVKIFTEEVVKIWKTADADPTFSLPPGFTYTIELEGVDGQSGHRGSGREGPIDVEDAEFTSAILAKTEEILASGHAPNCSICHGPVKDFSPDQALNSTICPSTDCHAVSHFECLSTHFKNQDSEVDTIVPRGGTCVSCGNYTLWGDVIRGCYRRLPPVNANDNQLPENCSDDLYVLDDDDVGETPKAKGRKRSTSAFKNNRKAAKAKGKRKATSSQSSEGESFDFDNISSSDSESESATPMKKATPGRPRKKDTVLTPITPLPARKVISPSRSNVMKGKGKQKATETTLTNIGKSSVCDINIASRSDGGTTALPAKRRPNRPQNSPTLSSPVNESTLLFTRTTKKAVAVPALKSRVLATEKKTKQTAARRSSRSGSASSSEGEFFDFDNTAPSSEIVGPPSPLKAKVGRPRKNLGLVNSGISSPAPSPKSKPLQQISNVRTAARVMTTPRRGEVIDLTMTSSNSGGESSEAKRRGRPRLGSSSAICVTSSSDIGLSSEKKTRGRPRKDVPLNTSRGSSVEKKARGRPRLSPPSPKLSSPKRFKLPLGSGVSSFKQQYHHSTPAGYLRANPSESRVMTDTICQPIENHSHAPSKSRITRSPNSGQLNDLEQALSSLTLATQTRTLFHKVTPHKENIQVIVLSD